MKWLGRWKSWLQRREAEKALNHLREVQDFKGKELEVELLSLQKRALRKQIRDLRAEEATRKEIAERESKDSYVV